jgi:hypothetical protein
MGWPSREKEAKELLYKYNPINHMQKKSML